MNRRTSSTSAGSGTRRPPATAPRAVALALLARRDLSRAEVRARLLRRGFEPEAVDAALDRLAAGGVLDDKRTARAAARRAAMRGRGRARALREVVARGVESDAARDAVAEVFAEVDEARLLDRALARRLRGSPPRTRAEYRRIVRALLAAGFEARAVLERLRRELPAGVGLDDT